MRQEAQPAICVASLYSVYADMCRSQSWNMGWSGISARNVLIGMVRAVPMLGLPWCAPLK